MTRTVRIPGWILAVAFIGIPLLEIVVLIQVGQAIGPWWTILLLIADSIFGAWLIKHEGRRALTALSAALSSGRMPARELADGALIVVGGTLMLTPGFVTDLFGVLCILPFTRPVARRALTAFLARRLAAGAAGAAGSAYGMRPGMHPGMGGPDMQRPRPRNVQGDVVQGEVVED